MDKQQIILNNNDLNATIDKLGAQLLSLTKGNRELIWNGDPSFWKGHAPILFPVCGGLINGKYYFNGHEYEMSKHGFVRFREFEVIGQSKNKVIFIYQSTNDDLKIYPFKFTFLVIYELTDQLNIRYEITNESDVPMYFNVGSHEGYLLEKDFSSYHVEFEQNEKLMSSVTEGPLLSHNKIDYTKFGKNIPLRYEDYKVDALVFENIKSKKAYLCCKKKREIELSFPNAKHIVLWSIPNAKFICIEPWDGIHDYVDSPLNIKQKRSINVLLAHKTYTFTHSIKAL